MKTRLTQITHALDSVTTTCCGRTVAGSMEISMLRPTCPRCKSHLLCSTLIQLENRWTMGHPDDVLRAEIDRLRGELKAAAA